MKRVWKCDFCTTTHKKQSFILDHEKICSFNPIMKNCYSCVFKDYEYEYPICTIDLDVYEGEDSGNCKGWKHSNLKQWRKIKIEKLFNE